MRKYLNDYKNEVDKLIKNDKTDFIKLKEEHLIKIQFFQHERLIHLLVTLFYAIYVFIFYYFSTINYLFLIVFFILLIILLFYVRHYFFLENNVQYLYKQYDEINKKISAK